MDGFYLFIRLLKKVYKINNIVITIYKNISNFIALNKRIVIVIGSILNISK